MDAFFARLKKGGRLAIITFHSLEDRIVKHTFLETTKGCTCPKDFPVCVCGRKPIIKELTKKPILPSEIELKEGVKKIGFDVTYTDASNQVQSTVVYLYITVEESPTVDIPEYTISPKVIVQSFSTTRCTF